MVIHELFCKGLVVKDVLCTCLTIVEVASNRPNHDVVAKLGCQLRVLNIAYAAIGRHHGNLNTVLVAETLQCGLSCVS